MNSLVELSKVFGVDSLAASRLVPLVQEGLDIHRLAYNSVKNDGLEIEKGFYDLAKKLIEQGEPANRLDSGRIRAIQKLTGIYGEDSEVLNSLMLLETPRSGVKEWASFASDSDKNKELFAAEALKARRPEDLRIEKLKDLVNLADLQQWFPLDSKSMSSLRELQNQSLSAARLSRFVSERPESRVPIVEQLIDRGADSNRFNEQMNLIGLPDDVGFRVADDLTAAGV